MRTFVVKDNKAFDHHIMKNEQVALYAWKINTKNAKYRPNLFFDVYLFDKDDRIAKEDYILDTKKFDGLENQNVHWDYYRRHSELNWITIKNPIAGFLIFSDIKISNEDKNPNWVNVRARRSVDPPPNSQEDVSWYYQIIIKGSDENASEGFLPEIIETFDVKMCEDYVETQGENKTLAASCPINPETNKDMTYCLNWRRTDKIGKFCRANMTEATKEESISSFCLEQPRAEDCKCINRDLHEDYRKQKKEYIQPDYCWYGPCASGYFLTNTNEKFNCGNNVFCQVFYNVDRTGTQVSIQDNVMSCSEARKLTSKNVPGIPKGGGGFSGLQLKLMLIGGLLALLLIFFKSGH